MAIDGLTDQQSKFIKKYLAKVGVFNRKRDKAYNDQLIGEYKILVDRIRDLKGQVAPVDDAVLKRLMSARLDVADSVLARNKDRPDIPGAHRELDQVVGMLAFYAAVTQWKRRSADLAPRVAEATEKLVRAKAEIATLWKDANEVAELGMSGTIDLALMQVALQKLGQIDALIQSGTQEQAIVEKLFENPVAGDDVTTAISLTAAKATLDVEEANFNRLSADLTTKFNGTLPADLLTKADEISGLIATVDKTAPGAMTTAAETVAAKTAELTTIADGHLADLRKWQEDLAAVNARFATLQNHKQLTHSKVKDRADLIQGDITVAGGLANNHDYRGASQGLVGVIDACSDAIKLADFVGQFSTQISDRQARYNDAKALGNPGSPIFATALNECRAKMVEAVNATKEDPINVAVASKAIEDISDMLVATKRLHKVIADARSYIDFVRPKAVALSTWQGTLADGATPLDPEQAQLIALLDRAEAQFAITNENAQTRGTAVENALSDAVSGYRLVTALEARKKNVVDYNTARTEQEARLAKFEGKDGQEAVVHFIARLKADHRTAEGAAGGKQFNVGIQILNGSEKDEAAMLVQLAAGAAFFPKYKALDAMLAKIEGKADADDSSNNVEPDPNRSKVSDLLDEAKALRAEAYSKGVAQTDWSTATTLIEAAQARVGEADKMIAAFKTIGDEIGSVSRDSIDLEGAVATFAKVRTAATNYAGTDFSDTLARADALMDALTQESESGAIATALDEAVVICENVITLVGKKKAYEAVRSGVEAKYQSDVVQKDTPENGISAHSKKIDDLLKAAAELAKAPSYDFAAATTKIDEALDLVNSVPAMLAKRAALSAKMQKVGTLITKLRGADYLAGSAKAIERLEKIQTDYAAAEETFDLRQMEAIATQADDLIAPMEKDAEDYKAFVASNYEASAKFWHDETLALAPDLDDEVFGERGIIKERYTSFKHSIARANYKAAHEVVGPIYWTRSKAVEVAGQWDLYKPVRDDTRQKLDDATTAANDTDILVAGKLQALEDRYAAATSWADQRRDYVKARIQLEGVRTDIQGLGAEINDFDAYNTALADLDTELQKLDGLNGTGTITPVLNRLRGKRTNAIALSDGGDRKGAKRLVDEAVAESAKAETDAADLAGFATETDKIGTGLTEDDADLANLCDLAKTQVATLVKEMDGVALMPRVIDLGDAVADAKASLPSGADTVRIVLGDVVAKLKEIRQEMAHNDQVLREIVSAQTLIAPLVNGHPEARYSVSEAQALMEKLAGAQHQLRSDSAKKPSVMTTLEEVLRAYHPLKAATDAQVEYVALRDRVAPLIEDLEKARNRFSIQDDIIAFRAKISEAEAKADNKLQAEGMALLKDARVIQQRAMLKAKMVGNGKPTEQEVKDILDGPGGDKALDEIVKTLDPRATREVLRVAMTVRFGCALEMVKQEQVKDKDGNETQAFQADTDRDGAGKARKGPNIKALYDSMCLLPSDDTLSNESLLGVVRVAKASKASDHHPGTKKMTMREGEAEASYGYGIGFEHELEGVPDNLKPKPGKPIRQFSWNTLHEVGHAVDDKLNFTNRKAKSLADWEYPSTDVGPFAQVIAKKFKYDKDYVARLMLHETNPPVPANPDPGKIAPDEWERRRITVTAWLENTFEGRQPWQTTSAAKACEINGRCYHESMKGYWVSYPIAERSKGVTGYQFRSPLEWFSELYAAFHSERLADAHPAREWLEKLKSPEEA